MNVAVIGSGYVGLVSGACFSQLGHWVSFFDKDQKKLEVLKSGTVPIFEPGLTELFKKNSERIKVIGSLKGAVLNSEIIMIAVGTPSLPSGEIDLSYYHQALHELGELDLAGKIIVNKSTVPVGTAKRAKAEILRISGQEVEVVSNPEFLREGTAIEDFMKPDRVVIGAERVEAAEKVKELYHGLETEIFITDSASSELIKYASNSYLATQISFINSLSWLCEKVGADVSQVAKGMKLDKRIGQKAFLNAGCGYGGSCFPKDVKGLNQMARENGVSQPIVEATDLVNRTQKELFYEKAKAILQKTGGQKVAVWGLAFKPGTDDLRDAPAIEVIGRLLEDGVEISAFDPVVKNLSLPINIAKDQYQTLEGADLLLIFTESPEFLNPDFEKMKTLMSHAIILDGRNIYDPSKLQSLGIEYHGIGR